MLKTIYIINYHQDMSKMIFFFFLTKYSQIRICLCVYKNLLLYRKRGLSPFMSKLKIYIVYMLINYLHTQISEYYIMNVRAHITQNIWL